MAAARGARDSEPARQVVRTYVDPILEAGIGVSSSTNVRAMPSNRARESGALAFLAQEPASTSVDGLGWGPIGRRKGCPMVPDGAARSGRARRRLDPTAPARVCTWAGG